MRILLLNPPGREVYIRDYLCSKTTKSSYVYPPTDLLMLSGRLAEEHTVGVLDAIAERLDVETALERLREFAPEVAVLLAGSVSWEQDRAFGRALHGLGVRVLALGDVLHGASEERLAAEPWIEAAFHAFANDDLPRYLAGERDELEDATVRDSTGRPRHVLSMERRRRRGTYRVPRPRHELFPRRGYRFPFARRTPFATVLTDFGCPYPCTFCSIGTLGHRTRPLPDVLEEIDSLRDRGIRELFFLDQTFGLPPERGLALCAALAERGDLGWTAFTRPDRLDPPLAAALAAGGCHTLILGIESADETLLRDARKGYDPPTARTAVALARRHGLRTVGTFVLGLPGETLTTLERTLHFALSLGLDFASLNLAVPRPGTPFRRQALALGLCRPEELAMDQSGAPPFLPTATLTRGDLLRLKRRFLRRFYLRPGYLLARLRDLRSPWDLLNQTREALALLHKNTTPRVDP